MIPKKLYAKFLPDGRVTITGNCVVTGKEYTTKPIPRNEFDEWQKGEKHIQYAMPTTSAEDREFLISCCSPEGWAKAFPPEDEDNE